MKPLQSIEQELKRRKGTPEKRKILSGFFKCAPGEYGEGDKFLGVAVPEQRKIAKEFFQSVAPEDVPVLLQSPLHEVRLTGLLLWMYRYERGGSAERAKIYRLYTNNTSRINNWDLVDVTAPTIVGEYLWGHPNKRGIMSKWAQSKSIWQRRIAIISTFFFIRKNHFAETLLLAEVFLTDKEDLIHKATGWMLREVGKRDVTALEKFLEKNASRMPRTMLRYAIEKFDEKTRRRYLEKK
jgi:3-methyladenine DNA glycosylase AlkD